MAVNVSVIITCFEKEKYLDECIKSVMEQTKIPVEIVIVHDGCKEPVAHQNGITIIYPDNKGVVFARSEGVRFSKAPLLLFLDADDKLSPDYLEKMVFLMDKYDIAYPNILWWYEQKWGENKLGETPYKLTPDLMITQCHIPVTCLMKRHVFLELDGFRNFPMFEDWDFWLRAMVKNYKFGKANTLLWYRQYPFTRNRQDRESKKKIHRKISNQFEVKRRKLWLKKQNTTS
jgi:glycosyltransferase involved in cell wall biosynthesis